MGVQTARPGLVRRRLVPGLIAVAVGSAVAGVVGLTPGCAAGQPAAGVGDVRLNQIQMIGSHNSYHVEASPREQAIRAAVNPAAEATLEYSHAPLDQQLAGQQVRQLELDLFADPAGGRYADPLLRRVAGEGPYDPAMRQPGTKVLHIQDIDYRSTCLTLVRCLQLVRGWSSAHPRHVPVAVLLEFKDTPVTVPGTPTVVPLPWTRPRLLAVEQEIASVFPRDQIITPDDVRRRGLTLEQSVLGWGWPTLRQAGGKVMFLMDNRGRVHDEYVRGNPSLQGRILFTDGTPGQPDAAFVERNDPTGADLGQIQDLVRRGYLVRTRADVDTRQARTGDTRMRDAALASGAQWVSTDYPVRGLAIRFGTDYYATLPGFLPARCNPVNAPPRCQAARLNPG